MTTDFIRWHLVQMGQQTIHLFVDIQALGKQRHFLLQAPLIEFVTDLSEMRRQLLHDVGNALADKDRAYNVMQTAANRVASTGWRPVLR